MRPVIPVTLFFMALHLIIYIVFYGVSQNEENRTLLSWAICAFNLILFIIFPRQILGMFTTDKDVLAAAMLYLLVVGIDLFPKSGNIIFGSGIKGYGEPSWMLKTQLFGTVFVITASTVMVMKLHMGIIEIFIMVVVDETVRFILNNAKLRRIRRDHVV